jgi:hypothetical protein
MERKKTLNFAQQLLNLFDRLGGASHHEFPDGRAGFAVGGHLGLLVL